MFFEFEWRDLQSFPGYAVSSNGLVWSCKNPHGSKEQYYWHPLKPKLNSRRPYLEVTIKRSGFIKRKSEKVHILMCLGFFGDKPTEKHQVRHLNGNSLDNKISNLSWGTSSENHEDCRKHGTLRVGILNNKTKLSESQVKKIFYSNSSYGKLSEEFNVTKGTIAHIKSGRNWKHLNLKKS